MGAWLKAHTVGVLVTAAIILAAIVGATLFVLTNVPATTPGISQVTYSQTQAGTNSDPVDKVVTSSTRISALQDLLTQYKVEPGVTDTLGNSSGCVGGLTSNVTLDYTDGTTAEFSTYLCGSDNPKFSTALFELLASWGS
jgi:hypothetical protein